MFAWSHGFSTVPNDSKITKIFMASLWFSLGYFLFSYFSSKLFFLENSFWFYFLSFLFNFVSMDYSPYVIKASDGSFKKAHVNMSRSRDDSTDCPCVFDLFRICEIMWILHETFTVWRHKNASWTSLNLNSSEWCWKKNRGLWPAEIKGHKSSENFYNGPMTAQRSNHIGRNAAEIFFVS